MAKINFEYKASNLNPIPQKAHPMTFRRSDSSSKKVNKEEMTKPSIFSKKEQTKVVYSNAKEITVVKKKDNFQDALK